MITVKKQNKLTELSLDGYKHVMKNEWNLPENLEDWLVGNEFKIIGSGNFSTVYKSPTENFVVKIYKDTEYDNSYDKKWYDYCSKNKGNPHLPKVGKIKEIGDWYIIFIEKLEPIPEKIDFPAQRVIQQAISDDIRPVPETDENYEYEKYEFSNIVYQLFHGEFDKTFIEQLWEAYPTILDIYNKIVKPANSIQVKLDLHLGNYMYRGNTLVISDPIACFLRNFK